MQVIETIRALQLLSEAERGAGQTIALVPTMGALHEGHLALVDAARARADRVWVSIFVNPTQFNEPSDLDAYPRQLATDRAACRERGVDVVFHPSVEEMYPDGAQTVVTVRELSQPFCGASRPGHFAGVTTIVSKLLLAAKPHVAVFGEKDYQQLAIIRRMVSDLGFDVEIDGVPTVREPDRVALSSRNVRLSDASRAQACVLVAALDAAERAVTAGETSIERLLFLVRNEIGKAPLARIDYVELRDPDSLSAVTEITDRAALLALAVGFPAKDGDSESIRLIDNRVLRPARGHVD